MLCVVNLIILLIILVLVIFKDQYNNIQLKEFLKHKKKKYLINM